MALWEIPLEVKVPQLGLTLTLRYPTPDEKADAKRLKAAILRSLNTVHDPVAAAAIEDDADRNRAYAELAADIEEHTAEYGPEQYKQVRILVQAVAGDDGIQFTPERVELLFQTDVLYDHIAEVWQESYFRVSPEVPAGSSGS